MICLTAHAFHWRERMVYKGMGKGAVCVQQMVAYCVCVCVCVVALCVQLRPATRCQAEVDCNFNFIPRNESQFMQFPFWCRLWFRLWCPIWFPGQYSTSLSWNELSLYSVTMELRPLVTLVWKFLAVQAEDWNTLCLAITSKKLYWQFISDLKYFDYYQHLYW